MKNVFTPLDENYKRLEFNMDEVKVISGDLETRGRGLKAVVEIRGSQYKVYGRSCGSPGCMCDAQLKIQKKSDDHTNI